MYGLLHRINREWPIPTIPCPSFCLLSGWRAFVAHLFLYNLLLTRRGPHLPCPIFWTFSSYRYIRSLIKFTFIIHLMQLVDKEDIIFKILVAAHCYFTLFESKRSTFWIAGSGKKWWTCGYKLQLLFKVEFVHYAFHLLFLAIFQEFFIEKCFCFRWQKGAEVTPDSKNKSAAVKEEDDYEEEGLPSPPLDEAAFFTTQPTSMELSQVRLYFLFYSVLLFWREVTYFKLHRF